MCKNLLAGMTELECAKAIALHLGIKVRQGVLLS